VAAHHCRVGKRTGLITPTRLLEEIHERLAGVVIECLPWHEFLERYDAPSTLFYLDPPYWGSEGDYGSGVFRRPDFIKLAAHLAAIAGRFMLSVNDVPETREIFARFSVEQVQTRYTVAGGKWSDVAEIVVTGPSREPLTPDLLSFTDDRWGDTYPRHCCNTPVR
jgi:DNA adenine methylase